MPALVNSKAASPCGTSGEEGTGRWPRSAKKSMKLWRTSALFMDRLLLHLLGGGAGRAWVGFPQVLQNAQDSTRREALALEMPTERRRVRAMAALPPGSGLGG